MDGPTYPLLSIKPFLFCSFYTLLEPFVYEREAEKCPKFKNVHAKKRTEAEERRRTFVLELRRIMKMLCFFANHCRKCCACTVLFLNLFYPLSCRPGLRLINKACVCLRLVCANGTLSTNNYV